MCARGRKITRAEQSERGRRIDSRAKLERDGIDSGARAQRLVEPREGETRRGERTVVVGEYAT